MEIEEKHNNPNYDERLRPKSWSDLPQDLLISVFERLSFANFHRAKSVCWPWYSASRQSVPNNQIPWIILLPQDKNHYDDDDDMNNSCTLFNPEEKHKLYKTEDVGVEFGKSFCLAIYGSWLLMRDPLYNLYIVNLFTRERIDLPSVELLRKEYELHKIASRIRSSRGISLRSPVFWIDEKTTKDYVVVWGFGDWCVLYCKKGDTSWNKLPKTSDCFDMVYTDDHKLYFLSYNYFGIFKIFDFSGEIPRQTFLGRVRVELFSLGRTRHPPSKSRSFLCAQQLVVTLKGIVLKVEKWKRCKDDTWFFKIFKVYSPGDIKIQELQIHSLGDESILFDQGIIVLANDGFIRNSIYFNGSYVRKKNDMLIFNLETQETTESPLRTLFDTSSIQLFEAQWFLPSFTHI